MFSDLLADAKLSRDSDAYGTSQNYVPLDVTFAESKKPTFQGRAFMAANTKRKSKTPELYAQRQQKARQNRIQAL